MRREEGHASASTEDADANEEILAVTVDHQGAIAVPLTMMCSVCRERPAVAKKGTRRFLCVRCATGDVWYELVGPLLADAPPPRTAAAEPQEPEETPLPDDPFAV